MKDLSKAKWTDSDKRNWKETIKSFYNIEHVTSIQKYNPSDTIFLTRCSSAKSGKVRGTPSQMYWGAINKKFYRMLDKFELYYGVCSDFLGVVFKDEEFDNYDVHPADITDEDKRKLGEIISTKIKEKGFKNAYFFNTSPLLSRPYFEMLYYSQIPVKYFSDLQIVREAFEVEDDLL